MGHLILVRFALVLAIVSAAHAQVGGAGAIKKPREFITITNPLQSDGARSASVVPGELLVRFRPEVSAVQRNAVLAPVTLKTRSFQAPSAMRLRQGGRPASLELALSQWVVVSLKPNTDLVGAWRFFRARPEILNAEPNYRVHLAEQSRCPVIPDDFDFGQQWSLQNVGGPDATAGADLHAPAAWSYTTGDRKVVVAVIDTGIDYFHPDLAANVWINPHEIAGNGVDDDGNGYVDDLHGYDFVSDDSDPMDDHGHGTHVAGIIGALGNNGQGGSGVCWRVSLMAVKAFDQYGEGDVAQVAEGIVYALRNGARIINASWEEPEPSQALKDAVTNAVQAGVLFVTAAGNEASSNPPVPAAYAGALTVAATDQNDQRWRLSNYGPFVALAAPGDNIFSALPNNNYGFKSGTSMAAAQVSGVAALALAAHPELNRAELENLLRNSTDVIASDKSIGRGRINAEAAVRVKGALPLAQLQVPSVISGALDLAGTASGAAFAGYQLDYGLGAIPTNWTRLVNSKDAVTNGVLFSRFSAAALDEGAYTIRLTVTNRAGDQASDRAQVQVSNVHISTPQHQDVLRAGDQVPIVGSVLGADRTYTIQYGSGPYPTNWSTVGVELTGGGACNISEGVLATWDTAVVAPNRFYTLELTAHSPGKPPVVVPLYMVYLDSHLRKGWPQHVPIRGDDPPEDWRDVVVADLDNDGTMEIVLLDHGNTAGDPARLLVYNADGTLRWSRDLAAGAPYSDIPVVGDIDGDGRPEIFVDAGTNDKVFAFKSDGSPLVGSWPVAVQAGGLGKVLADLRGDGQQELIGYSQNVVNPNGSISRPLLVLDKTGHLLQRWDVPGCAEDIDPHKILPAVANLDGGPGLEIVAVSGCDAIAVYKLGQDRPLWVTFTGGVLAASPVVADLKHDGGNEIIIGAAPDQNGQGGGLYGLDEKGNYLPGWPVLTDQSFTTAAALGDLAGDGRLEICIPSWKSGLVHVLTPDGFEATGWPVGPLSAASPHSSAVIGDTDGDGHLDVVVSTPGDLSVAMNTGQLQGIGGVQAWHFNGQPIDLTGTGAFQPLVMESSDGSWQKAPPVTLADIDGAGHLSLVAASVQDRTYLPDGQQSWFKNRSSIYVWDLTTPVRFAQHDWPTFQANPSHTGSLSQLRRATSVRLAELVQNSPATTPVQANPDKVITDENTSITIDVLANDTGNGPLQLVSFTQAQHGSVATTAAEALVYTPTSNYSGVDSFRYVVGDAHGSSNQGTVTVLVKPVDQPPVAQDFSFALNRNSSQQINFAAVDPDSTTLTFAVVAQPQHGTLFTYPTVATYYPERGFFGTDSFTYQANDGQLSGPVATVHLTVFNVNNPPQVQDGVIATKTNRVVDLPIVATDLDQDPLRFQIVTPPTHGHLQQHGQSYAYVPKPGFIGTDSLTFKAYDGKDWSQLATITITVTDKNTAPQAQDSTVGTLMNTPTNILLVASDPESDPLSYRIVSTPLHGRLRGSGATLTYTPDPGYFGPDRFTFRANDGELNSNLATVSLLVSSINAVPIITDQQVLVGQNQSAKIALDARDSDGDALLAAILRGPGHGRLAGSGVTYTYTPNTNYTGSDSFTYEVWDGQAYSPTGQVTVTVQSDPPPASSPLIFQSVAALPGGETRLVLTGAAGHAVSVQVSTNLVDWSALASGSVFPFVLTDTNRPTPARFYRAVQR